MSLGKKLKKSVHVFPYPPYNQYNYFRPSGFLEVFESALRLLFFNKIVFFVESHITKRINRQRTPIVLGESEFTILSELSKQISCFKI